MVRHQLDLSEVLRMPPIPVSDLVRNRLLATLHPDELNRFTDLLALRDFARGHIVAEPGQHTTEVLFPVDGLFSVVAETADGGQVEAGMIGRDGAVGLAPFLGAQSTMLRTMCQVPGSAFVADTGRLLSRADGAMATAIRRYALVFMTMASQGAACMRLHPVEQRAARWLLMVSDRVERNPFELTQEFLAIMLGVARPSVTTVAGELKKAGLIDYRRGSVTILDRPGLENLACECYRIIAEEYRRSLGNAAAK
jgi:CRP-like cAMP-binding protein